MKPNSTHSQLIFGILLLSSFLTSTKSIAQPDYDFRDPVLISGTNNLVGAVYIFSNVKAGVDARVTMTFISPGITVTELDGLSGYPEALQPTLVADPLTSGYLEMNIEFLIAGTSTLFIQTEVPVTCIDVDGVSDFDGLGNPLNEFDGLNLGGGYVDYQLSGGDLSVQQSGNWFSGINIRGIDYPGRDTTAKQAMYTAVNGNISSCIIRVGVNNQSTVSGSRLRSVYFKKFKYPNSVLAKSAVLSFQGLEKRNIVELKGTIERSNLKTIEIERAEGSNQFVPIGEVNMNAGIGNHINFNFLDKAPVSGNVLYRLRMISLNGGIRYSNILVFDLGDEVKGFKIYPSVVQTSASLQVRSEKSSVAIFQLADYSGRVILQKKVIVLEGINTIVVDNFESVHPGNYVALLKLNNKVYSQKIFKQ